MKKRVPYAGLMKETKSKYIPREIVRNKRPSGKNNLWFPVENNKISNATNSVNSQVSDINTENGRGSATQDCDTKIIQKKIRKNVQNFLG